MEGVVWCLVRGLSLAASQGCEGFGEEKKGCWKEDFPLAAGEESAWGEALLGFAQTFTSFPYGPDTQDWTGWSEESVGMTPSGTQILPALASASTDICEELHNCRILLSTLMGITQNRVPAVQPWS